MCVCVRVRVYVCVCDHIYIYIYTHIICIFMYLHIFFIVLPHWSPFVNNSRCPRKRRARPLRCPRVGFCPETGHFIRKKWGFQSIGGIYGGLMMVNDD